VASWDSLFAIISQLREPFNLTAGARLLSFVYPFAILASR
jgi:hypothetical protein